METGEFAIDFIDPITFLRGIVHRKRKFTHYLPTTMQMEGWVKSLIPQKPSGVSGVNSVAAKSNTIEVQYIGPPGFIFTLVISHRFSPSRSMTWRSKFRTWWANSRSLSWGKCVCLLTPCWKLCWAPNTQSTWTWGPTWSRSRRRSKRRWGAGWIIHMCRVNVNVFAAAACRRLLLADTHRDLWMKWCTKQNAQSN